MLIVAVLCTAVYGYAWLFEMTANPMDQLRFVMDLAGRAAAIAWVTWLNIVVRERVAKRNEAKEIVEAFGIDDGGMHLVD